MKYLKLNTEGAAFDRFLHVGRPNIGNREALLRRINEMLDRRWLSNRGPLVEEFEAALAAYLGVKHCVAVCNATIALEIAIRALDLRGEVIVPSLTFIATAHALHWQGITPVFCDIDPGTLNLDPVQTERLITPRTTGLIGVHLYGRPCAIEALQELAGRRRLTLLFDAAHAFGCSHGGQLVGRFGACEVFSFHATKFFNTFEGGAVATNDDALAARIRLMQNFGFAGLDHVVGPGTNGKMTEVCAAMGLTGLEALEDFVQTNRRNFACYGEAFAGIPGIWLRPYAEGERTNYQFVVVEVGPAYPLSRDELMDRLHRNNVLVRRYFWPGCHRMEPYRTLQPEAGRRLPVTEAVAGRILVFPMGAEVRPADIRTIGRLVREPAGLST